MDALRASRMQTKTRNRGIKPRVVPLPVDSHKSQWFQCAPCRVHSVHIEASSESSRLAFTFSFFQVGLARPTAALHPQALTPLAHTPLSFLQLIRMWKLLVSVLATATAIATASTTATLFVSASASVPSDVPTPIFTGPVMGNVHVNSQHAILTIICSCLLHWLLFQFMPIHRTFIGPPSSSSLSLIAIRSYLLSTFHAVLSCSFVLLWFYFFDWDLFDVRRTVGGGLHGLGDEYAMYPVSFSVGYFIYDTTCMLLHPQLSSTGSYIHHIVIGAAFLIGLYGRVCLPYHFLLLFEELSTPSLNLKSILRHHSFSATLHSYLFVLFFFLSRMIYGMWIYFSGLFSIELFWNGATAEEKWCLIFQLTLSTISRILNVYWMILIFGKVFRMLSGTEAKTKGEKKKRRKSISEEVEEVVPSLVSGAKGNDEGLRLETDGNEEGQKNGNGKETSPTEAAVLQKRKTGSTRSRKAD